MTARRWRLLAFALPGILGACAMLQQPAEPPAHEVVVKGEVFILRQLTDSTWTANSAGRLKPLANTPANTATLREAVETISGCKVTDSDFSRQGKQFDAQVDCDHKHAN